MRYVVVLTLFVVFVVLISGCQLTYNYNETDIVVDNGSSVEESAQQVPSVSRGGNTITPEGNELGLSIPPL